MRINIILDVSFMLNNAGLLSQWIPAVRKKKQHVNILNTLKQKKIDLKQLGN